MVYLIIIIIAAVAGIARLAVQHRREQKMHLLDDFRTSLERLSSQPLPAHGRPIAPAPASGRPASRRGSRRRQSPRGEWDRVAPHPSPGAAAERPHAAADDALESFFAPVDEVHEDDYESRRQRRSRRERKPLLAGRLWRKPREPWLWTYENRRRPAPQRSGGAHQEVAHADLAAADDLVYEAHGNLAYAPRPYGSRPPHSGPGVAGPHDSVRRSHDESRREAASRRLEARRATRSRLS